MKFTTLRAFEKHLEGSAPYHFSSLFIILGKELFQRKEAIEKLVSTLKNHSSEGPIHLEQLDGGLLSTNQLMQELDTFNLFCKKRILYLESLDKLNKDGLAVLEKYLNNPSPSICLLLSATALHRGTNFYKKCEKVGIILDFPEEKPWEKERSTAEWVAAKFKAEGKAVDMPSCQQLVKLLGTDQQLLSSEIEKLVCYVGARPAVLMQDIATMIAPITTETIWQLGEAIFRRNGATALTICKQLLLDDHSFFALLRQLRTQFQTELQVCTFLFQGGGPAEITQQFPYMKGNILERHITMAQGYGLEAFRTGLLLIDETELQAKNSGLETVFLAELLIIKLISKDIHKKYGK